MIFFWKNWLTIFSISVTLCIDRVAGVKTHTWTHNFFNYGTGIQDDSSLTSPGQIYGACKDNLINLGADHKFSIFCTFITESAAKPIDEEGHVRSCNFSLDTNLPKYDDSMFIVREIIAITEDKAVLKLDGLQSFLLLLLDFVDCKIVDRFHNDYPMDVYAVAKNKIEVVMSDKRAFEKQSRVTLNLDSKTENKEKQHWFDTTSGMVSIKTIVPSPILHRIVVDTHDNIVRIYAVSENGSIMTLKYYPIEKDGGRPGQKMVITSTTHGVLSVCTKFNNTWTFSQFDLDGDLKFETKIKLEDVTRLSIRNLPRGGLLLLIAKCDKELNPMCIFSQISFVVKKLDASGQLVGTLNIDNPSGTGYKANTHVFENEKKELCLSDVYQPLRSKDFIKLKIICLSDNDFAGKVTWPTD